MQCSAEREKISKTEFGPGHNKKVVNWEAINKTDKEKSAQRRRKIRARKRRKAYADFIDNAFHGKNPVEV